MRSWTRPPELFIEVAVVLWLIDLIRKPVPEWYRRKAAAVRENPRPFRWFSLSKAS
jgi:hypothetical protein